MRCSDNEIEMLEEEIKENIEWLGTSSRDEVECVSVENLEAILTRFFNRKITLTLE
jgi:hypothetical protein